MTRSRLILHIGAPKSGTTVVQAMCADNRDRLLGKGLLYPGAILRGMGHHDLAFLLSGGFPDWAKPADVTLESLARDLARECAGHEGDILLSSENFQLFPRPAAVREFLERAGLTDGRELHVLSYLRRQDALIGSWYNQMVKAQGFGGSIEEVLSDPPAFLDFESGVSVWADVFGQAAMSVRLYEDAVQAPGGLPADFLSVVAPGLSVDRLSFRDQVNTRLTRDVLEIQRIINTLPLGVVEKRGLHHAFMALSSQAEEDWPLMTDEMRTEVFARYAPGNDALARTYFNRDRLYEPPRALGPQSIYPGLTVETAVRTMAMAVLERDTPVRASPRPGPT